MEKKKYVSPSMEVHSVALEANIAVQSPIRSVDLKDWEEEGEITPDTGDIFLSI